MTDVLRRAMRSSTALAIVVAVSVRACASFAATPAPAPKPKPTTTHARPSPAHTAPHAATPTAHKKTGAVPIGPAQFAKTVVALEELGSYSQAADQLGMLRQLISPDADLELWWAIDLARAGYADSAANILRTPLLEAALHDTVDSHRFRVYGWGHEDAFLDGHYTGPHAGKGDLNTPILRELSAIAAHPVKRHVILIDDARLFIGRDDYPSLESLREAAVRLFPSACFEVADDIIRIYPP